MFPSQPEIGQDMARERQERAAKIRLAYSVLPEKKPKRWWPALLKRVETIRIRPVSMLGSRIEASDTE